MSNQVNKIGNDGPEIIEKLEKVKEKQFEKGLGRFFQKLPKKEEEEGSSTVKKSPDSRGIKRELEDGVKNEGAPVKTMKE